MLVGKSTALSVSISSLVIKVSTVCSNGAISAFGASLSSGSAGTVVLGDGSPLAGEVVVAATFDDSDVGCSAAMLLWVVTLNSRLKSMLDNNIRRSRGVGCNKRASRCAVIQDTSPDESQHQFTEASVSVVGSFDNVKLTCVGTRRI
jgi:hypothetical protein